MTDDASRTTLTATDPDAAALLDLESRWGAHNYLPLPVVIARARGVWVYDVDGRRYLDCLSAYSALNQGHAHPRILAALWEQAQRVTLTSRAFHNDRLPLFCRALAERTGLDAVLPMNSGAEAVDRAEIIVCAGNFHGRTTTIISASTEEEYRRGFGPFTPGFVVVPYGDLDALAAAIRPETCAFLVEPIQCEAGIVMPPDGYLAAAAALCREHHVLLIADEIQTGLGRTGRWFACEHEGVQPDVYVLGKALSGGCYPVSAVVGRAEVMQVFTPGSHGSTFGGSPLACAIALAALDVIEDEGLVTRSAELGRVLMDALAAAPRPPVRDIRGRGLLVGIELDRPARPYCERLMQRGLLCKETHERVIRLAPPLVIERAEVEWLAREVVETLGEAL
jgi:ornithine--oxo-acid transaminase